MKRVAEIIHIVDSEREDFLKGALGRDAETEKALWLCGVRKQQYFALNDLIFMTFEYKGKDFKTDMEKMAAYLDSKGLLVQKRRKDVPVDERETTNWWAPVKSLGTLLVDNPFFEDEDDSDCRMGIDGAMSARTDNYDTTFSEDDWTESIHI